MLRLVTSPTWDKLLQYLFEDFALDSDQRELRRGPTIVPIAPLAFDLLEFLIRNRERVLTKDDLIASIWNGRIVSESALSTCINAVRSAIHDTGGDSGLSVLCRARVCASSAPSVKRKNRRRSSRPRALWSNQDPRCLFLTVLQ